MNSDWDIVKADMIRRHEDADEPGPMTGPLARPIVEDQITAQDAKASRDIEIFLLGALMGACWAGLIAIVIL